MKLHPWVPSQIPVPAETKDRATGHFDGQAEVANRRGEQHLNHPAATCRDGPGNSPADGNAKLMRSQPFRILASRAWDAAMLGFPWKHDNISRNRQSTVPAPWQLSTRRSSS